MTRFDSPLPITSTIRAWRAWLPSVSLALACGQTNNPPSFHETPEPESLSARPNTPPQGVAPPPLPELCTAEPTAPEDSDPVPVELDSLPIDLAEAPVGWASVEGGTTGGHPDGEPTAVTRFADLQRLAGDSAATVVVLSGHVSGSLRVQSNTTLLGAAGASLTGSLTLDGVENVVVRNLTIRGLNCEDSPTDCSGGSDAVSIRNSRHVWFDHVNVFDGSDGNLDVTQGSDFVTVSWSKFWYCDTTRNHRFSNLIGSSDDSPADVGHLRVTFHHNWWADNVEQRMPRTRYGQVHVFNNLYTSRTSDYCANAGFEAQVLLEGNVFQDVHSPHTVSTGNLLSLDNVYERTDGDRSETGSAFTPPYDYERDSTDDLADRIREGAGPRG